VRVLATYAAQDAPVVAISTRNLTTQATETEWQREAGGPLALLVGP